MTTLRLLLTPTFATDPALPWALHDRAGACTATGRGAADTWPDADTIEVVIAAAQVRLASVALPPLPPARVAAAAAFALEDQLAGPADDLLLAAAPQRPDGRVVVAIVARALLATLKASMARAGHLDRLARVVAESELAAPGTGWCWCVPEDAGSAGFVRLADGSAFPVDAVAGEGTLPPELALALAAAARTGAVPAEVRVDAPATDASLAQWQRETGVAFVRGTPWSWHAAAAPVFARATNLWRDEFASVPAARSGGPMRMLVPALAIVVAALALHVLATFGEWTWWRIDAWRAARAWTAIAVAAGIPEADAQTPAAARAALERKYAAARHAQGLAAPNDALPLLARAAPALASMPPGTIKSATYADQHWTLDLQRIDAAALGALDARLRQTGTPAISAITAAGTRLRIGGN